ncbi:MAG: hypothetical protein Q7I99_09270, partial [Acholeplasmataceae bacterium]|nr:hypothetical protein [Acholeplasmataceae bacterium]
MRRNRHFPGGRFRYRNLTDEEILIEILIVLFTMITALVFFLVIEYGRILFIVFIVLVFGF